MTTSEEKKELLPCPFCGSSSMLEELGDHHGAYHNLGCSKRECPAYHVIYTESEAPVEDSVNWWNTRAPAQESEAGAVRDKLEWSDYEKIRDFREVDFAINNFILNCTADNATEMVKAILENTRGYYSSAPAIETAAIMKCVEVIGTFQPTLDSCMANDLRRAILALIPQDGRTALEEFGMKVAEDVASRVVTDRPGYRTDCHAIVTNLIGVPPLNSETVRGEKK